jgi:hypothetical protein
MTETVMVLIKDHEAAPSEAMCASGDVEKLIDCAMVEDMSTSMTPLREIGDSVEMSNGDELRIEETKLL